MNGELRFLMWNLKRKSTNNLMEALEELYKEHNPNILLLVETTFTDQKIVDLSNNRLRSVMLDTSGKNKDIRLYVDQHITTHIVNESGPMEIKAEDGKRRQIKERMIFFHLQVKEERILLVCVHFPSKLKASNTVQQQMMKRWKSWIEEQEKILNTDKTIIMGDFNLNPHELSLYSHEGLSAHPTLNVKTKVKTKYYNPMWSTMGDFIYKTNITKVPGTYFRDIGEDNIDEMHWNTLDGLVLKNALVPYFSKKDLEIITETMHHKLCDPNYMIDARKYSDHLPIKFNFYL